MRTVRWSLPKNTINRDLTAKTNQYNETFDLPLVFNLLSHIVLVCQNAISYFSLEIFFAAVTFGNRIEKKMYKFQNETAKTNVLIFFKLHYFLYFICRIHAQVFPFSKRKKGKPNKQIRIL